MIAQSLYEPQLRSWLHSFASSQVLVLTLDEFAEAPSRALARIGRFLGLGPFPRLVLNWKWNWNVGGAEAGGAKADGRRAGVQPDTLRELRTFFAPHTDSLVSFLRKRGQPIAARYIERWPRR